MADKSEFYQKIKDEVKIVDFAMEIGFTVIRKGPRYFSLKEYDSVIIDPDKNCYWRNSVPGKGKAIGKGGSVIDFAIEFTGKSMYDIISDFSGRISWRSRIKKPYKKAASAGQKSPKNKTIELPRPDSDMHRVFAYLIKARCINQTIVQEMVHRKMLYQDTHYNCVFVGYDFKNPDKVVFACKRGTNTYKPFYGDVEGCDYDKCFYVDNGSDRLVITESFIDAMSVMTLIGRNWKKYNYLALAGAGKWQAIKTYLTEDIKEVYFATDNDEGGITAAQLMCCYIKENHSDIVRSWKLPPKNQGKDWNKVLQVNGYKKGE